MDIIKANLGIATKTNPEVPVHLIMVSDTPFIMLRQNITTGLFHITCLQDYHHYSSTISTKIPGIKTIHTNGASAIATKHSKAIKVVSATIEKITLEYGGSTICGVQNTAEYTIPPSTLQEDYITNRLEPDCQKFADFLANTNQITEAVSYLDSLVKKEIEYA